MEILGPEDWHPECGPPSPGHTGGGKGGKWGSTDFYTKVHRQIVVVKGGRALGGRNTAYVHMFNNFVSSYEIFFFFSKT